MPSPTASVIVPTRSRAAYLEVALASIAPQVQRAGAELIVVDDANETASRELAERHGARHLAHARPLGPNAARNTGIESASGDLLVFTDDDVEAGPGWLESLLAAAGAHPDHEAYGGPIRARIEGTRVRFCGREGPPITFLDLGPDDREAKFVWSANMMIRRSALERVGPFDATLDIYGDEQDWQERLHAAGGSVLYVAAAGVDHRRSSRDATLRALSAAARARGRNSRRYDARRALAPPLGRELRVLAGCLVHAVRRRCGNGLIMAAHSLGRVEEALRPRPSTGGPDFLSGSAGLVAGRRGKLLRAADMVLDAELLVSGRGLTVARAARTRPQRRSVLAIGVDRPDGPGLMARATDELARSRHSVELVIAPDPGSRGKFENLNALLAGRAAGEADWLLVLDDDVVLPCGFLDRFLLCAEAAGLELAQPAHRLHSHAAWPVTRRAPRSVVRETAFVEIGPVTAFAAETLPTLLPFPDVRMGWGLDAHWAALAREHGWTIGIVDATPILHAAQPVAADYSAELAVEEASEFLAARPYVPRDEADRTLRTHRRLP